MEAEAEDEEQQDSGADAEAPGDDESQASSDEAGLEPHDAIEEALQQLMQMQPGDVAQDVAEPEQEVAPADVVADAPNPPADGHEMLRRMGLGYVARAARTPEVVFATHFGEVRYNTVGCYMRAHCVVHADCTRQRTCRPSDACTDIGAGQGRPLGALYEWLRRSQEFGTREEHMGARTASRASRLDAREEFLDLEGSADFARYERERRRDEGPEPNNIR